MKRSGILGLVLVAIAAWGIGTYNVSKAAETVPPDPSIIAYYK